MRAVLLSATLFLGAGVCPPRAAATELRRLALREAIEISLRSDPQLLGAVVGQSRSENTLLRAQLDRFSLRVDASLAEQFRATNLGGKVGSDSCFGALPLQPLIGVDLLAPTQLLGREGAPSAADCGRAMGTFVPGQGATTGGIGLFNASASLQVPLFTGFRITANVSRAQHQREAATAQVQQERRRVALDVVRTYWGLRRAALQQKVSQAAIGRYEESLTVIGARVRAGLAPPVDQNRMETRRQRELARLKDLEGIAAEGSAQLLVLLGLPGDVALELTEDATVGPPPPMEAAGVDELLQGARRARPDLRFMHQQVLLGRDGVRLQKAAYYPQLSGSALLQFGNNPFNPLVGARAANDSANPFTNIAGSAFLGATLSMNLFDTLNTFTAVRDASYEAERLEKEEQRVFRLVEADVRTAHARLVRLYRTREPLEKTRDLARDTLGIIDRRYRNGDALVLEFLDAQLDLLNAEIDLANSAASIALGWGELALAAGRMPGEPQGMRGQR